MERYSEYKDSGVKWLGEIPSHWKVCKIKCLCNKIFAGGTPSTNISKYWDGQIPWIPSGCCHDCNIFNYPKTITEEGLKNSSTRLIPANTTVMAMTGATCSLVGYLTFSSCANQSVVSYITKQDVLDSRYIFYLLQGMRSYILTFQTGGAQGGVNVNDCQNFIIPHIPFAEQLAIASYLDSVTSKIDRAIAQQQRMIELLNERKQIIINNAVTKGLDPNVPMKDSGVEWIGMIPEHWEVLPIKHFKSSCKNSFVDGPFGSNLKSEHYVENGEVYVIESGMVTTGVFVRKDFKTISFSHFKTIQRSECKSGDIIIAKIGAKFGMSAELPDLGKTCVVSGNSLKLTLNQEIMLNSIFVFNMSLAKHKGGFIGLYQETAQPALSLGGLNNMYFPVPPLKEQKEIDAFLKEKLSIIETTIEAANKQISLLQERKQIIINDVVTGKVKVV